MVAIGTFFIPDRYQAARQVVQEVEQYVPLQAKDRELLFTIMVQAKNNACLGVIANKKTGDLPSWQADRPRKI